jgi:trigger factor
VKLDITEAGPCKKTLSFVLPASQVDEEFEKKFDEIARSVPIPGFRVGRAPHDLIEKRFGKEIAKEVTAKLIEQSFEDTVEKNEWKVLGEADFDISDDPAARGQDYTYAVTFEVNPVFELGEYSGLAAEDPFEEIQDDDVEAALERSLRQMAELQEMRQGAKAKAGCVVSCRISACAIEDGEEHEFYASEDLDIDMDEPGLPGLPLPALADALTGKRVDDRGEVEITLPQDHAVEEWRGLPGNLVFEVLAIKKREQPEAGEAAQALGFDGIDAWKDSIRESLTRLRREAADAQIEETLVEKLLEMHPFDLPQGIVDRSARSALEEARGNPVEPDPGDEEWQEAVANAERELRSHFLLEAIADEELIYVSESDVERRMEDMSRRMGMPLAATRQLYERHGFDRELRRQVRMEKTRELLRKQAQIG